ncbi:hypothetical protein CYANOKiyG1_51960 [Okeania sp. KiyG1]|nr:hypothetical protein CYANOKiyG1_51960 [Okeania sp. KiyG1]
MEHFLRAELNGFDIRRKKEGIEKETGITQINLESTICRGVNVVVRSKWHLRSAKLRIAPSLDLVSVRKS